MKVLLIVVAIFMLVVMDPIMQSNSPLVGAACTQDSCYAKCKRKNCSSASCNSAGNCVCRSCLPG
uniref:AKTx n=1 Tax=Romanomermis culicivorax TaxID=13658 RepID=A0A915J4G7_ROMCU